MENKEYKVITANTPLFASTPRLKTLLQEEAQAGWQLLEKLDNYKIRLVRDVSARDDDNNCAIDPYRTEVGMNKFLYLGVAALVTIIVIYLIIQAAAMSVQ